MAAVVLVGCVSKAVDGCAIDKFQDGHAYKMTMFIPSSRRVMTYYVDLAVYEQVTLGYHCVLRASLSSDKFTEAECEPNDYCRDALEFFERGEKLGSLGVDAPAIWLCKKRDS